MYGIKLKAVGAGVLLDIAGSIVVGFILTIVAVLIATYSGETSSEHAKILLASVALKAVGLLGTTLCTVFGGYVAARMSVPDGAKNALAVGIVSLSISTILAALMPSVTPLWKLIVGFIITVPAAMAGGWVARRSVL